jgi:hypothetical protein
MNIRGIELLRQLNLSGPRKEFITKDLSTISLDNLYNGAKHGATIIVFDYSEPINQNPLLEKNIHQYQIDRKDYFNTAKELKKRMLLKKVKEENIIFLTHQTYLPEDILYSGRIAINTNDDMGLLMIDAVKSLRVADTDFNSRFRYQCPIVSGRLFFSKEKVLLKLFNLPTAIIHNLGKDIISIPGNPTADFEIYIDSGEIFYHDLFLNSLKAK